MPDELKNKIYTPDIDIFAFQEMNTARGTIQNDKPIFSSITSLMKSQAYEMSQLPDRKTEKCLYQFNLITVVDAKMLKLHFSDINEIKGEPIDSALYIADYIINKEHTTAKIHFINKCKLNEVIENYYKLHKYNLTFFKKLESAFYKDIFKNYKRHQALKEIFFHRIEWWVRDKLKEMEEDVSVNDVFLVYNDVKASLTINMDVSEEAIEFMTENAGTLVSRALKQVYRYGGDYEFSNSMIPF